ncbi:YgiQ family radical SAM protein [Desulfoluna butyratoxydans]|uniref:Radical sam n=1 Tax=Desulfoluna butyratoxydans TaxID=231438 RepID=A0A4U8YUT0_9BACT|nr:YgiQ family radical SAM protein [Desulfoluna butyratoxydans]VFQ47337.1 radical sam [Desulfoluna butyratoxydans]
MNTPHRFLPATRKEMDDLGWERPDVILVTGDSYVDAPAIGAAVVGRVLERSGFKVAIIAQPDIQSDRDITRLGEPALFWGVTGGSLDSMVANYTASGKKRKRCDYTPGGDNIRRPDRAVIAYTNLIRRHHKGSPVPIVLGGIEASLRRVPHYDAWQNRIRGSILFDSKADYLLYGMGERSVVELARALASGDSPDDIAGLCRKSDAPVPGYLELPPLEEVKKDKEAFARMFTAFKANADAITARGLVQKHDTRYLVQNPPQPPLSEGELDDVNELPFTRELHPLCSSMGEVRAMETIRFSIATHRGCYGDCNFCAIALHQGRTVSSRSEDSILRETKTLTTLPGFKGYILDAGGPTGNMYGFECEKKLKKGACSDRRCLYPSVCPALKPDHSRLISLLKKMQRVPGIKKVFSASGIRPDLVLADKKKGDLYLKEVVAHHTSGQLKIAPEHTSDKVLSLMGKPQTELIRFRNRFLELTEQAGMPQFLTYYFMAAHPGCGQKEMEELARFCRTELHTRPEQAQIFTPTPSTLSTLMYVTEKDPETGKPVFVEKQKEAKERQKAALKGTGQGHGRDKGRKPAGDRKKHATGPGRKPGRHKGSPRKKNR